MDCEYAWKVYAFAAFCIEEYKTVHKMPGSEVAAFFEKFGVIDYLFEHYEVLHSLGRSEILRDIELLLENRRGHQ